MARLESEQKGGFYPTPPSEMELIMKRLYVKPGTDLRIMDPCCGEGNALAQWKENLVKQGADVTTFGVELEKSRAAEAEGKLDHVLKCGYEEVRMTKGALSAMYLNPPFGHVNGTRLEALFLKDLSDYISEGAVLVFNIPKYVLEATAKLLASRFTDIRVYRFTDAHYESYKQVIVYAKRRRTGLRTKSEMRYKEQIEKDLQNYAIMGKEHIPLLSEDDLHFSTYTLEQAEKKMLTFESTKVEAEDILKGEAFAGHFDAVERKMTTMLDVSHTARMLTPAMPLKHTHIAAAIAAGALPETMGSHMLVGVTKRVQNERKQINPKNGKEEVVTTFKPKSVIRVFSDSGIYNLK